MRGGTCNVRAVLRDEHIVPPLLRGGELVPKRLAGPQPAGEAHVRARAYKHTHECGSSCARCIPKKYGDAHMRKQPQHTRNNPYGAAAGQRHIPPYAPQPIHDGREVLRGGPLVHIPGRGELRGPLPLLRNLQHHGTPALKALVKGREKEGRRHASQRALPAVTPHASPFPAPGCPHQPQPTRARGRTGARKESSAIHAPWRARGCMCECARGCAGAGRGGEGAARGRLTPPRACQSAGSSCPALRRRWQPVPGGTRAAVPRPTAATRRTPPHPRTPMRVTHHGGIAGGGGTGRKHRRAGR
jgi:hypothetical protein